MTDNSWHHRFWWRWIVANALAELLGLGAVAALAYVAVTMVGEPHGPRWALVLAAALVVSGAVEGLVVGFAQARVLRQRLPHLQGWVRATVVGAVAAWALGMIPSTVMSINAPGNSGQPPEIGEPLRLLLAACLGLVAGPVLAFFQWRILRRYIVKGAAWWLPANALAWAAGMPVVFAGAHLSAFTSSPLLIVPCVALSLLAAGGLVGTIHGRVLVGLLSSRSQPHGHLQQNAIRTFANMYRVKAAASYFGLVFGTGFVLGAIRVPFLVPRLGVRAAELIEMPFMLVAIVLSARYVVRRFALPATYGVRLSVGFLALALLVTAELLLTVAIQSQTLGQFIASRDPVSGTAYLLMLGVSALMPAILASVQPGRSPAAHEEP